MEVFKKIFSAFFRLGFRVFRVEKKVLAICLQFEIVIYLYDYDHNGSDFILEEMKANTAEKSFNNIVMFFAQSFGTLAAAPVMFLLGGTNRPTTSLSPPIGGDSTSTTNNSHPSFSSKV